MGDLTCTNCIHTGEIASGGITSTDIGTDAVGHLAIASTAVRSDEIADGQVMTVDIADDAITLDKIGYFCASGEVLKSFGGGWGCGQEVIATECPGNQFVKGIDVNGNVICATP